MTTCKQWERPAGLFNALCSNEFFPVEGQGGCPICVSPSPFGSGDPCHELTIGCGGNGYILTQSDRKRGLFLNGTLPQTIQNGTCWNREAITDTWEPLMKIEVPEEAAVQMAGLSVSCLFGPASHTYLFTSVLYDKYAGTRVLRSESRCDPWTESQLWDVTDWETRGSFDGASNDIPRESSGVRFSLDTPVFVPSLQTVRLTTRVNFSVIGSALFTIESIFHSAMQKNGRTWDLRDPIILNRVRLRQPCTGQLLASQPLSTPIIVSRVF